MGMVKEFKEFAMRGNVVDMAVGIVIGAAFGKIVSSLVSDVIMPPIGLLLGGIDFSQMAITLKEETAAAESVNINYGVFLSTVLDFIIVAFAIFMVIKQINRFKKKEQPVAEPTTKDARNASPPLLSWRVVAQTVLQSFNPHRFAPWRNNRRFNSRLRCFPFSSWRDLKKILSSLFLSPPFCSPSHTCSCFPPSISGAICAPLAA